MSPQYSWPGSGEAEGEDQSRAKVKIEKITHSVSESEGINRWYVREPVFHRG